MGRLQNQEALEHCGQLRIQYLNLGLRKLLQKLLPGVPGALDGAAERLVEADAQYRLPPLRKGAKGL